MNSHNYQRRASLGNNKPPVKRLNNKVIIDKNTGNDINSFDKPSKLVANNIVYNANNTPKLKINTSNKTSDDNTFSFSCTNNNYNGIKNKVPKDYYREIKSKDLNNNLNNIYEASSNLNDIESYNNNSEKIITQLREEIGNLQLRGREKDRQLRDKDRLIKELYEKNRKLESEVSKLRERGSQAHERKEKTAEEEELALALAKINEMEKKQQRSSLPENRSSSVNHHRQFHNQMGINFHPSDVINVDEFSDPFFSEIFGHIRHSLVNPPLISNQLEDDPITEYEDHLINEICPNPDRMTYEQLLELEEKVGKVSKGLTQKEIEKIPTIKYNKILYKNNDKCTVCQFEYTENEILRKLTCGHIYHKPCVDEWLLKEKTCPVCKVEVKIVK